VYETSQIRVPEAVVRVQEDPGQSPSAAQVRKHTVCAQFSTHTAPVWQLSD